MEAFSLGLHLSVFLFVFFNFTMRTVAKNSSMVVVIHFCKCINHISTTCCVEEYHYHDLHKFHYVPFAVLLRYRRTFADNRCWVSYY